MSSGRGKSSLLYYCSAFNGGIADYAHEQANALAELGIKVELLSTSAYRSGRGEGYVVIPGLVYRGPSRYFPSRLVSQLQTARTILHNTGVLARRVAEQRCSHVLLAAYAEYLAPLWAPRLRRMASAGTVFGSVVHDPVRGYVVGPLWWHRWSVAAAYSFQREAFVHEPIDLDTVKPMPQLRTTVIPHGPYRFSSAKQGRTEARAGLHLPPEAFVLLAFGHIRDDKNLDLVLRAMKGQGDVYLLVAGTVGSPGQRPVEFYQRLADQIGVADRCRWVIRFIPADEIGNIFAAADLVLLTYSKKFRSASGVLNAAVWYRKPCLASSGEGNLRSVVHKYNLGLWVPPDDPEAVAAGIAQFLVPPPIPRWDLYEADNSWRRNAEIVAERMGLWAGN